MDKRNNPIKIEFVKNLSDDKTEEDLAGAQQDRYLYVHSKQKERGKRDIPSPKAKANTVLSKKICCTRKMTNK